MHIAPQDMPVHHVVGDLLACPDAVICQQLNCLCVRPKGLAAAVAKAYPYADVYSRRRPLGKRNFCIGQDAATPGTISVSEPRIGQGGPIVIGLYGQLDFGRPGRSLRTPKGRDSAQLRIGWFKSALVHLEQFMRQRGLDTVAFPYTIGCGLAGGSWPAYLAIIEAFAARTHFTVNIYRLP